jgi:hypothetical protein
LASWRATERRREEGGSSGAGGGAVRRAEQKVVGVDIDWRGGRGAARTAREQRVWTTKTAGDTKRSAVQIVQRPCVWRNAECPSKCFLCLWLTPPHSHLLMRLRARVNSVEPRSAGLSCTGIASLTNTADWHLASGMGAVPNSQDPGRSGVTNCGPRGMRRVSKTPRLVLPVQPVWPLPHPLPLPLPAPFSLLPARLVMRRSMKEGRAATAPAGKRSKGLRRCSKPPTPQTFSKAKGL